MVYDQNIMDIVSKEEGNIFFIPLFLPLDIKENTKNFSKYKFTENGLFAFGRLIEIDLSGGDLIEVFNFIGNIPQNVNLIINSGIMFNPIHISLAFSKKRWKFIFNGINYNRNNNSNYKNITFLLGTENNPQLWQGGKIIEIKTYDTKKYDEWIVYPPTKIEKNDKRN
jgi:hypothetical protein